MQSQRSSSPQPSPTAIDSENQVVFFADPCAMCGTKKRRVCPLHQKFNPRKKLFAEPSPPLPTTLPPLFHTTNSTDHQSSSSHEDHHSKTTTTTLPQKYLDPSFVINTTPEKIKIQSTTQRTGTTNLSTIVEESSPESASQQSQQRETSLRNWVHDSNGRSSSGKGKKITKSPLSEEDLECLSSGTEDESHNTSPLGSHQRHDLRSPVSASKPPRPPKRRQSVNNARPGSPTRNNGGDPGVRSPDSETKQGGGGGGSSEDKESLNALKECVGMFNKLLSSGLLNNLQDRSPQEIIHQKKGIMELIDSENILKGERGVYKGSCLCSCGKKYQMILSILPDE